MANELTGWRPRAGVNDTSANGRGPQGVPGESGERGIQGERGPQGERGEQGAQGIQGKQGERGEKGERGEQGAQGIQGKQGERGEKGERGEQGAQGIQGKQGERGEKGERGEQGAQGIQGEKGAQGEQGIQGIQGIQGERGPQGSDGKSLSDGDIENYLKKNYPNLGKNNNNIEGIKPNTQDPNRTPATNTALSNIGELKMQNAGNGDGDKKKKNNNALLIVLAAAVIAGIAGLIASSFKKKKDEKNLKTAQKDKEQQPKVAENNEGEQKEAPEKEAENGKGNEKLSNVNLALEFDNASSEFSPMDKKALEAFAEAEKSYQDKYGPAEIPVVGTASKNGPKDVNQRLGSERANNAANILKAAGLENTSINVNLADEASTLDSNGSDRHAGSRNDRTALISFGLKDEKGLAEFYETAEKNLIKKGMTPKEAKEYIEKVQASQKGSKIDLHASNNPESGKFYSAAREKDGAFKKYDDTKQGFVESFERGETAQTGTSKDAPSIAEDAKGTEKNRELSAGNKETGEKPIELGGKDPKTVKMIDIKNKEKDGGKKKTDLAEGINSGKKTNKENVKKKGKDRV